MHAFGLKNQRTVSATREVPRAKKKSEHDKGSEGEDRNYLMIKHPLAWHNDLGKLLALFPFEAPLGNLCTEYMLLLSCQQQPDNTDAVGPSARFGERYAQIDLSQPTAIIMRPVTRGHCKRMQ